MVQTLRGLGMQVTVARGPYDAIASFFDDPAKLLVLSLEGLVRQDRSLLNEVRRISPDLRVLLLVPTARRADVTSFLEAGADAILFDPCYPDELRWLARSLLRSAATDALTGLPNRAAYEQAGVREISRVARENRSLALAIVDLDLFKEVNREVGYRLADGVLREAARRLRDAIRLPDLVARWGGEEFVVLLGGLPHDREAALRQAIGALARVRVAFQETFPVDGGRKKDRSVTFSAGVALYPHEADTLEDLFDAAAEHLDSAKEKGRNRIEPWLAPLPDPPPEAGPAEDPAPA